jgi:hypothetical protein
MLLEFLLGNLWHPKHKAWEDKDWPVPNKASLNFEILILNLNLKFE